MTGNQKQIPFDLDSLVESQLNLQVKISYLEHHDFMLRHQLNACAHVLDVGTGNGAFLARLAQDHPRIQFFGIDKRKHCIENCKKLVRENLEFLQVDMFGRDSKFDFSQFDGFLMRYFLLHVDHSKKILELLKSRSRRPAKLWIIDLDFSQFSCDPPNKNFDRLTNLVKEFCIKTSVDSMAGQRVLPMLQALDFKNVVVENIPFSTSTVSIDDFALYLRQEVQCYSRMGGRLVNDPETFEILRFIDEYVTSGRFKISYGMVLLSVDLI